VAACILTGRGEQYRIMRRLAKKYGLPMTRAEAEAALANGTASATLQSATARLNHAYHSHREGQA
jgi:hypothetical protein